MWGSHRSAMCYVDVLQKSNRIVFLFIYVLITAVTRLPNPPLPGVDVVPSVVCTGYRLCFPSIYCHILPPVRIHKASHSHWSRQVGNNKLFATRIRHKRKPIRMYNKRERNYALVLIVVTFCIFFACWKCTKNLCWSLK